METSQPYRIYTPEALGSAIRHYRQEAGLTQEELAERAGLNRTYLSDMVATLVVAVVMTCMVVMAMLICRRPPEDRGVRASGRQPVSEPRGKGHGCLVFRTFRRLQPVS